MAYTPNPTWQDAPSVATPVTAATLNRLEGGLVTAAGVADGNTTAIATKYTKPSGGIPNSDLATPGGTVAAATTTTQGIMQLAGDLSGTAAAPVVFGTVQTGIRLARNFTGSGAPPATIVSAVAGDTYTNVATTPPTVYDITGA